MDPEEELPNVSPEDLIQAEFITDIPDSTSLIGGPENQFLGGMKKVGDAASVVGELGLLNMLYGAHPALAAASIVPTGLWKEGADALEGKFRGAFPKSEGLFFGQDWQPRGWEDRTVDFLEGNYTLSPVTQFVNRFVDIVFPSGNKNWDEL